MDKIGTLLSLLNKREKELLEYIFISEGKNQTVLSKLKDYAVKTRNPTDLGASYAIYKCKPDSRLSHLKRRLRELLLRVLAINIDNRSNLNSKLVRNRLMASSSHLVASNLILKGRKEEAVLILEDAIRNLARNEMFEEILLLQGLLHRVCGDIMSRKKLESIHNDINSSLRNLEEFYKLDFRVKLQTSAYDADVDLGEVDVDPDEPYRIQSLKYRCLIYDHYKRGDYLSLQSYLKEFESLSSLNSISKSEKAGIKMLLGNTCVLNIRYQEASTYYLDALDLFVKGSQNHLLVFINWSYVQFYIGKYTLLKKSIKNYASENSAQWVLDKLSFINFILAFSDKRLNEALQILVRQSSLYSLNRLYRIWIKIWEIITLIELRDFYWLDQRLDSLRKLVGTKSKTEYHREYIILSFLRSLYCHQISFCRVMEKRKNDFMKLEGCNEKMRWNPLGYELIRFDTWFQEKLKQELEVESKRRIGRYRRAKRLNIGGSRVSEE